MGVLAPIWGLRPHVYRALDRGPGRRVLARLATWAARRETTADVEFRYGSGMWMYRAGDVFLPGGPAFVYRHGRDLARAEEAESAQARSFWFHTYTPQPGETIIDAGASVGAEAWLFSKTVGPSGRVFSLEANPATFRQLEARVRWNHLENVIPLNCALVDRAQQVFVEDRVAYERNTVSAVRRPGDLLTPVEGMSLDELCERHGVDEIGLLKLNIEGAEGQAIEGMTHMIQRTKAVVIACHDFWVQPGREQMATKDVVVDFLSDAGFEVIVRDDDERGFVQDHVHGVRR